MVFVGVCQCAKPASVSVLLLCLTISSSLSTMEDLMTEKKQLPITCPLCGRKNEYPLGKLSEGAELVCPFCGLKLILHGHMWEDIHNDIRKLNQ